MKVVLPALAAAAVVAGAIYLGLRPKQSPPARETGALPAKAPEKKPEIVESPQGPTPPPAFRPPNNLDDDAKRRLAEHSHAQWKSYFDKENERRIREIEELLGLTERPLKAVRAAFTAEREAFDALWVAEVRRTSPDDRPWIERPEYVWAIKHVTDRTDAAILPLLDDAQTEYYGNWRKKYNLGRYFSTEKK